MTSKSQHHSISRIALILVVGGALATVAHATPPNCYRYISTDGSNTYIDPACSEQLGITPIFVRDALDGYDILVPLTFGAAQPYNLLPEASVEWLASETNLDRMKRVIDFAESTSELYAQTSEGGITKTEYVNYTLASWLNTSGATAAIASMASASIPNDPDPDSGSNCPALWQARRCSSCQWWHCWPSWIFGGKCSCDGLGTTCCVIGISIEAPE